MLRAAFGCAGVVQVCSLLVRENPLKHPFKPRPARGVYGGKMGNVSGKMIFLNSPMPAVHCDAGPWRRQLCNVALSRS
jgi:hypothetical protein